MSYSVADVCRERGSICVCNIEGRSDGPNVGKQEKRVNHGGVGFQCGFCIYVCLVFGGGGVICEVRLCTKSALRVFIYVVRITDGCSEGDALAPQFYCKIEIQYVVLYWTDFFLKVSVCNGRGLCVTCDYENGSL